MPEIEKSLFVQIYVVVVGGGVFVLFAVLALFDLIFKRDK